jgi:hypothetical protein
MKLSELNWGYVNELAERLTAENSQRNGEYDVARQRVDGKLWGDSTNPTPHNRYSLSANYLLPITQKHVQLLMGRQPGIQVMPVGTDWDSREHAEKLEGVLYSTWDYSNAHELFQRVAWDGFVLRRGVLWYGWVPRDKMVKYHYVSPDDFYPEYDGDDIYHCILIHRRHVEALRRDYPSMADKIDPDNSGLTVPIYGQDQPRLNQMNYTTVIDYYDSDCNWMRLAGDTVLDKMNLAYTTKEVPFIEFPYNPSNGNREPKNGIDQLVELVQYLSQLISQKADIIRTYANPTIIDTMSGQSPEEIRRAVAADGSVLPVARDGKIEFLNWTGATPTIDDQITLIMDMIFDLSGKPRSAFGQTVTNQSGVVTNLALTPTLQSNEAQETIWGKRLSLLNRRTLELVEKFGAGKKLVYRGRVPIGADLRSTKLINLEFDGREVGGWYESRIKWPSAIRTDDPVYVQNVLSQLTSDPPAISLYSALELLGHEDVESEIDRIQEQREDPRLSPETVAQNMGTAMQAGPGTLPGEVAGAGALGPTGPKPPPGLAPTGDALQASASPYREALS